MSRRAVVGAALLGTAGCSIGSLDPTSDDPTIDPSGDPAGTPADTEPDAEPDAEPDVDAGLVDGAVLALSTAHRVVRAAVRTHPDLDADLAPLERLHRAQAGELGGLRGGSGRVPVRGDSRRRTRALVAAAEESLQESLVAAAVAAQSGALARLLASMAASVAQHRSVL